ncbi:hypothetical protein, partial [Corynebacterium diphtheriae]|uniref:hypothetical protein n=3 Tax=Corynebacterium diphtheriae TaxID=1717 RepID=UPI001A7E16EC
DLFHRWWSDILHAGIHITLRPRTLCAGQVPISSLEYVTAFGGITPRIIFLTGTKISHTEASD